MVNVWGEYDREMSEEQRLLKESLLSWAEKNLSAERVIKMNQQGYPFPRDIIKELFFSPSKNAIRAMRS